MKELHLMVLWNKARMYEHDIIEDLEKHVSIVEKIEVEWTKEKVAENFTRFYGVKLDSSSNKVKECGGGKFLLITFYDENPKYEFAETSRGFEYLNSNILNLKSKYRKLTNGGSKIHATNSVKEVNHDITLLLGLNTADYLKEFGHLSNNKRELKQDLVGANGWDSLEQLFYVLNNTSEYVVLRNHECLPDAFNTKEHGDIDLLVQDKDNTAFIMNAIKVFKDDYRVHYKNVIKNENVYWDLRFLGDNYYCLDFEKRILKEKVLSDKNFYIQSDETYFYSLVYHAVVQKKKIASDYYSKTKVLFDRLKLNNVIDVDLYPSPFDAYFILLDNFMKSNGYAYVKPIDISVYFNKNVLKYDDICEWLETNYHLSDVTPIFMDKHSGADCIYFGGKFGDTKLFIKWGGIGDEMKNEFIVGQKLYSADSKHFVKPYFYKFDGDKRFVATEFIKGFTLDNAIDNLDKNNLAAELKEIAQTLLDTKICHRDLRPANILIDEKGKVRIIDLSFAVLANPYKELKLIKKKYNRFRSLGDDYAKGVWLWDDMYSLNKVMSEFGLTDTDEAKFIRDNIGKLEIAISKRLFKLVRRRLLVFFSNFVFSKKLRRKIRNM